MSRPLGPPYPGPKPSLSFLAFLLVSVGEPGRQFGHQRRQRRRRTRTARRSETAEAPRRTDSRSRGTSASRESFRGGCHHGSGPGSARPPLGQAGSGSVLPLREERGIDEDLPPGGEQRESSLHEPQLLSDCGREARRLRALRGRAVRRWASLDYARRSPDRPGNAHCFRLPHPGQGRGGERGQAERQYRALTAQRRPINRY